MSAEVKFAVVVMAEVEVPPDDDGGGGGAMKQQQLSRRGPSFAQIHHAAPASAFAPPPRDASAEHFLPTVPTARYASSLQHVL